ncbi:hypothetical protein Bca4012_014922 [Brassica carinata]|uniref:Uncharacterized protein n=1 Tax=Brassica carinata TaxID=52824 RepID=A0A8X7P515_BRACI|nr:hypothetical protein Bca52824_094117 [Brassica carinata]
MIFSTVDFTISLKTSYALLALSKQFPIDHAQTTQRIMINIQIDRYKALRIKYVSLLLTNVPHFLASQVTEFLCTEKVESNETGSGWCYISCSKCYTKLQPYFEIYTPPYIHEALYFLKINAADKNNGSNYLPMNPTGTSAAEEASDELDSGRIIVEEQQRPGAGCRLKEARTE